MTQKTNPIESLHLGDRVKLSAEAPAGNADVMLQGKVGEVIEVYDDGGVSVRFDGGRLLMGRSTAFERLVELGLKANVKAGAIIPH